MRIFLLIKLFILSKWIFILPRKKKILIYDQVGSDFLKKFFREGDYGILYTRFEEINIPILLISFFKFSNERLSEKYVRLYINRVKPKLIITFIDNNKSYYKLKRKFKNIILIAIQNALRPDIFIFFENLKKTENLSVDYLFVMSEVYQRCYSKLIKGNIIVSGSLKNNSIPIRKNENNSKKLLFISQCRKFDLKNLDLDYEKLDVLSNKRTFILRNNPDFKRLAELKLLPMMAEYCDRNNVRLEVCGNTNDHREALFYKLLIDNKTKNWAFFSKVNMETTYRMLDEVSAVAFIGSTLGFEALARKIPTASFSVREGNLEQYGHTKFEKETLNNFAIPKKLPDHGPFWTNQLDKDNLYEILNLVLNISQEEWEKIYDKYLCDLVTYDEGNRKFINIMKTLNISLAEEFKN